MAHIDVRVSRNVKEAYTLPGWLYTDPKVLEIENREIFSKTWQFVGHLSQVERPGDFFTTEVANSPIIVVHGNDGQIRAFYNVCSHRASRPVGGCV